MLAGIVVLLIVLDPFFFDLLISKCQHERLVEVCPVGLDDLKTLKHNGHDYTPTPQKNTHTQNRVVQFLADFPAVFFHISHWYLSWNTAGGDNCI